MLGLGLGASAVDRSKAPGVVGDVAGQVPAQQQQAQTAPVAASAAGAATRDWASPGAGGVLPASADYPNETGRLGVLNLDGPIRTKGHPFFTPLGANGRACVTCHQPGDAMSVSVSTIKERWAATGGKDPLFAAVDGSNCPSLPQGDPRSHSLLLEKGLFRIFLPFPPRAADGSVLKPEFSIEVVRDPTGCNTDPVFGLKSDNPMVSVFRRPRPLANVKYLLELPHGVPPNDKFFFNDKTLLPRDPETGGFVSMQLLSDGRQPTLRTQAVEAAVNHLQKVGAPSRAELDKIIAFEKQIYVAQVQDIDGGALTGDGAPPGLGPRALADGAPAHLANNAVNRIFGSFKPWLDEAALPGANKAEQARRDFRASAARGADIFWRRRFIIKDVGQYNSKGLSNPFKRSCGSGCHNTLLAGMDLAPGFMDLGLNTHPTNDRPDLPLFKVTCKASAPPQAYLGRTIYTYDPGRALITGKCVDVGSTMTQQMRGLAARAPYFTNGSAANLRELVDYYDRRFNIGYSERDKQDLVNFMRTL
ncbi:hypothetical protein ABOZ73_06975 [Caulobacter sp. 73W]|uniref:Cytochrome c domain-containing protein n=1 Tax=Caulobacter sp. 73W TaxID=3161137 RepID=A0AB39KY74_9CAUL